MSDSAVYIHSMGHFHPESRLDNEFFDSLDIGSDAQWVEDRTGIKSRRSVLHSDDVLRLKSDEISLGGLRDEGRVMSLAKLAAQAWDVCKSRSVDMQKADLLICGTSVPDYDIPANACTIASEIGVTCPSVDINSACSSFVMDLHVGRGLITSGMHQNIYLFTPERYSLRMNYNDKNSCVLFGDGAACATLSNKKVAGSLKVLDTFIESDPEGFSLVQIPDGGHFSQQGRAVQKFAISKTLEASRTLLDRNDLTPDDIQYFAGHQANLRMINSAADRLGFDESKHLFNVDQFGNQGAAGAPAVLSMNWDKFKTGDKILVAVVGSGLTWGAALLEMV